MRRYLLGLGLLVGVVWLVHAPTTEAQGCVSYSSPLQGYLYGYCYGYPFDGRIFPVNAPSGANATTFVLGTLGAVYPNNALSLSPPLQGAAPSLISAAQTGDSLSTNPTTLSPVNTLLGNSLAFATAGTAASGAGTGFTGTSPSVTSSVYGVFPGGPAGAPASPSSGPAPASTQVTTGTLTPGLPMAALASLVPGLGFSGYAGYGYPYSGYPFHSGLTVTYNGFQFPIFGWPGSFGYPFYVRRGFDPSATLDQKWQSLDAVPLPSGGWQLIWTVGTSLSGTSHEIFQCPQPDTPTWACRSLAVLNSETRTYGPVTGGYTYVVRSSGYGGYTGTIGWGGNLEAESTRLPLPVVPPGGWPEAPTAPASSAPGAGGAP